MDRAESFSTFRQTLEFPSTKITLTLKMVYSVLAEMLLYVVYSRKQNILFQLLSEERRQKLRGTSHVLCFSHRQFSHYETSTVCSFIPKRMSSAWLLTRRRTRSSAILSEQKEKAQSARNTLCSGVHPFFQELAHNNFNKFYCYSVIECQIFIAVCDMFPAFLCVVSGDIWAISISVGKHLVAEEGSPQLQH
jgi:hypothetical protein